MKTLYLIRHAKSDWSNGELTDFERPLNSRGKKDAPFMAAKLYELQANPKLIITSTATRAISTAEMMAEGLNYSTSDLIKKEELYHASAQVLLNELNQVPNEIESLAIVAHNPGITRFANYLTEDYIDNIVTTGIVKIEFDIEHWQEIIGGLGTKRFYIYPKMYH